jgi:hypothetical protein
LELYLCRDCQFSMPEKYKLITKTRAIGDYRLTADDLSRLDYIAARNPHFSTAARMQLFLQAQVEQLAAGRWGSPEPYIVTLSPFSQEVLAWLLEDLERLKGLPPDKFQFFIADRLERFGLQAQMVGDVYRKDGGVDIIAYPKVPTVPFLLAVQAKHHRTARKTSVGDVRDFHGVLSSSATPFHMGMIVTNTTFTPDAEWFANNNKTLLRLRDLKDLQRWLREDFINEHEWREIPNEIELAPGIMIPVVRPTIILPNVVSHRAGTLPARSTPTRQRDGPFLQRSTSRMSPFLKPGKTWADEQTRSGGEESR